MTVAFDNTFLTLVLNPNAPPRPNPATGSPVSFCKERIEGLINNLAKQGERIIVPAPVLAEAYCIAKGLDKAVEEINGYDVIEIAPFDQKAAYELAEITRHAVASGDKRAGSSEPWQRIKFDRQIVAVAVACGAGVLYTDDDGQTKFAELAGLRVVHTWDLSLPPEFAQTKMDV